MNEYRAPLEDIRFVLEHVVGLSDLAALPGFEHAEPDVIAGLLEEAGKFMSEVLSPLNRVGDVQGSRLEGGEVVTPDGFREAYEKLTQAGWGSVGLEEEYGGGGLPYTVATAIQEMIQSANMAFGMCPALREGAIEALSDHGSDELKQTFLPKLVLGEWGATMDLTESQAGTDLAALRCSAEPAGDGTYRIKGTKIFITWGDHDMVENIIHLVLARTPDAPPGVRGISCFIVPKLLVGPDGALGARNDVKVVSLEHKLGIHASPTCVLNYGDEDGAVGYLIGEENRGLRYMFTMMNRERIFVGCQGVAIAERAYQLAAEYARERRQGRAIGSAVAPGESSPIVEHADVRRMLLTMKSTIEAMRCLLYDTARADDLSNRHPDPRAREEAAARLALLTPIVKTWLSESGVEVASTAIQVHGGMGYVEEAGVAQLYRDVRVTPIYEGTSGVQALDLVTRKLAGAGEAFADIRVNIAAAVETLNAATDWILEHVEDDPRAVAAGAMPYLQMFGVVAGGYYLARSALVARRLIEAGEGDVFPTNKLVTARFYAEQILPQAAARLPAVTAGAERLFEIDAEHF
jgi:alkylation response protein AidB-like acyl-CoA dehydrogenase